MDKACYVRIGLSPLNAKLNPICHLLALLGARHILHISRIRVKGTELFHRSLTQKGNLWPLTGIRMFTRYISEVMMMMMITAYLRGKVLLASSCAE